MMSKQRLRFIDIAKGIGIICVIIGHTVEHGSFLFNVIFSFHMPLFFIVSGMLFKKADWSTLIKKRFSSLIVPYLTTIVIFLPFFLVKRYIKYGTPEFDVFLLSSVWGAGFKMPPPLSCIEPIGAIWFLLAMFGAQVLFCFSPERRTLKCLYCCTLAITGWLIGRYFWLPIDLCVAMVSTIFLFLGSFIAKIEWEKIKFIYIALLIILWVIGWTKTLGIVSNTYPYYIFSVVTSSAGCVIILLLSFWFEKVGNMALDRYFAYMGRYSLVILCFHFLELRIIPWEILDVNIILACLLKVLFLSFIPLIICRIPLLAKLYKLK